MRSTPCSRIALLAILAFASLTGHAAAQAAGPAKPLPIERTGPTTVRIGGVRVDTARKELTVTGSVTEAMTLEFIATTKGGNKSYESALELDAEVLHFNFGLILIGLDPDRGQASKLHIDPTPPSGDPVEIWVEWDGGRRRARAEQLVYNAVSKQTLSEGPWVYTGSTPSPTRDGRLSAEHDGTLIGFVHTPSPLIESPRPLNPGSYGANRLNPALNLAPGTNVTVTVRTLPRDVPPPAGAR